MSANQRPMGISIICPLHFIGGGFIAAVERWFPLLPRRAHNFQEGSMLGIEEFIRGVDSPSTLSRCHVGPSPCSVNQRCCHFRARHLALHPKGVYAGGAVDAEADGVQVVPEGPREVRHRVVQVRWRQDDAAHGPEGDVRGGCDQGLTRGRGGASVTWGVPEGVLACSAWLCANLWPCFSLPLLPPPPLPQTFSVYGFLLTLFRAEW